MNLGKPRLVELTRKYQQLIERIRSESDVDERKLQSEELEEVMEAMFAVDLEQRLAELDQQSAVLREQQASLETRRTQREQIIKTGLEQALAATDNKIVHAQPEKAMSGTPHRDDLFAFPIRTSVDVQLQVVSDKTENECD